MAINKSFFVGNRKDLQRRLNKNQAFVLAAHLPMQRSADTEHVFSQERNFYYLSGLDLAGAVLVITKDHQQLIMPKSNALHDLWLGAISQAEITKKSGLELISYGLDGWQQADKVLRGKKAILAMTPQKSRFGVAMNPARSNLRRKLVRNYGADRIKDGGQLMAGLRRVKQPIEIANIQLAIDATGQALVLVNKQLNRAKSEAELEALVSQTFSANSLKHGYEPIVASAKNACTIHYLNNSSALLQNQFVLLDVGAEAHYYSADITRTLAVGKVSARHQQVYQAVRSAQEEVIKLIKPGLTFKELEKSAAKIVGQKLIELKLISKIDSESVRKYFPHGVSHSLGLDVHDANDYSLPLEAGMVITVEPGIYISKEAIGVRIEDDILVTKTGAKNLSKRVPK